MLQSVIFCVVFFVSVLVVLEEVQEDGWGVPSLELLTNTHTCSRSAITAC